MRHDVASLAIQTLTAFLTANFTFAGAAPLALTAIFRCVTPLHTSRRAEIAFHSLSAFTIIRAFVDASAIKTNLAAAALLLRNGEKFTRYDAISHTVILKRQRTAGVIDACTVMTLSHAGFIRHVRSVNTDIHTKPIGGTNPCPLRTFIRVMT